MTDYEKICSFKNLYQAHIVSRRGKRHRREVIEFEMNLCENLIKLQRELTEKTYSLKRYYHFTIYEPKERRVDAIRYPDRVVQHCLCDQVIIPRLKRKVIYDNAACQLGKGTHFAIRRLTKFLQGHYKKYGDKGYVLKCDISKYFASLCHEVLKEILAKELPDEDIRNLIFHIIDSFEISHKRGVPLGNQTSQWFGIFYLNKLDHFIKEKLNIKCYVRYMDDLVLVHHDKEYLKQVLQKIQQELEQDLKLNLNNRTQIFPIKNGLTFLGWRFYLLRMGKVVKKLKAQSKIRYFRRLKHLKDNYQAGQIGLDKVKNCLAAYNGHLLHGHTFGLRKYSEELWKNKVN